MLLIQKTGQWKGLQTSQKRSWNEAMGSMRMRLGRSENEVGRSGNEVRRSVNEVREVWE